MSSTLRLGLSASEGSFSSLSHDTIYTPSLVNVIMMKAAEVAETSDLF